MEEWVEKIAHSDRAGQVRKASAGYANRRRQEGWRRVAVWVPDDRVEELKAFVAQLAK